MSLEHSEDPTGSQRSALPTRAMTMVMVGLAVLALIAILAEVIWLRPRHDEVDQLKADRTSVLATSQRFATLANTYTPETFDDVAAKLRTTMTTKLWSKFEQETQALRATMNQIKLSSKGTVLKQGVASVDADSAVVLVVVDADATSTARDSVRHFRWQLNLAKIKGTWLVDDFSAVSDPETEVEQP